MELKDLKIGESVVAITYEDYKKQHPGTKKTKQDPLFQEKSQKPQKSAQPATEDIKSRDDLRDLINKVDKDYDDKKITKKEWQETYDKVINPLDKKFAKQHKESLPKSKVTEYAPIKRSEDPGNHGWD